jgi:uncharacterized protein YjiS (DUF1127 family)
MRKYRVVAPSGIDQDHPATAIRRRRTMIATPRDLRNAMEMTTPTAQPKAGLLRHALAAAWTWYRTAQDRRRLAQLSDSMLQDIGLTRADVNRETLRPFWEPIDHKGLTAQRHLNARRRVWAK